MRGISMVLATMLYALVLATPAAAKERGDVCEDPTADPSVFVCGYLTVTLLPNAGVTIDEVIASHESFAVNVETLDRMIATLVVTDPPP